MRVSRTDGLPVESIRLRRDVLGPRERVSRIAVAGIELGGNPPNMKDAPGRQRKSEQLLTDHSQVMIDARPFEDARTTPNMSQLIK